LGEAYGINALVRLYCGEDCCLNETGIPYTRPGEEMMWYGGSKMVKGGYCESLSFSTFFMSEVDMWCVMGHDQQVVMD